MPASDSRVRVLLLSLIYPTRVSFYDDWRDAFTQHPAFDCTELNIAGLTRKALARRIDEHDAIIVLHSCNSDTLDYFAPLAATLGQRRRGRLLAFVGNEYNSPYVSVVERTRLLHAARCDIIATQLLQEAGDYLYGGGAARVVSIPHALNPTVFKPGPAQSARRLDIGFKGYKYPAFLGDDDRNRFLAAVAGASPPIGLAVDISEDRRLGRDDWAAFLSSCRGTASTEAGSWFISPDDTLIQEVAAYLRLRRSGLVIANDSMLRRAVRYLPLPVKSLLWSLAKYGPVKFEVIDDNNVAFADLNSAVFQGKARAPVYGKAISSRHFDAIGTKTCQIMLRGRFNDILKADEHYIAVDADHANIADALRRFADAAERERIVERAYELVMSAHTYAHRVALVRDALSST